MGIKEFKAVVKNTKEIVTITSIIGKDIGGIIWLSDMGKQYDDTDIVPLIEQIDSFEEYIQLAKRTINLKPTLFENLIHCKVGIRTELAEIEDMFKKSCFYGGGYKYDKVNHYEELGDTLWYFGNLADLLKPHLEQVELQFPFNQESKIKYQLREYVDANDINFLINSHNKILTYLDDINVNSNIISYSNLLKVLREYFDYYIETEQDFKKILVNNINKLLVRYVVKFDSIEREKTNLKQERKILES